MNTSRIVNYYYNVPQHLLGDDGAHYQTINQRNHRSKSLNQQAVFPEESSVIQCKRQQQGGSCCNNNSSRSNSSSANCCSSTQNFNYCDNT